VRNEKGKREIRKKGKVSQSKKNKRRGIIKKDNSKDRFRKN